MSVRHHLGLGAHIFPVSTVSVFLECPFVHDTYALSMVVNRIVVERSEEA